MPVPPLEGYALIMSYAALTPDFYRLRVPDSPWHAGAPGWASAPWPGWGENPNLVGPPRLAVNGLGCGCSARTAVGDGVPPKPPAPKGNPNPPDPTLLGNWPMYTAVGLLAATAALFYFKPKFVRL